MQKIKNSYILFFSELFLSIFKLIFYQKSFFFNRAYCRVSTFDQTTQNQIIEINAAGFKVAKHRIIEENISGSVTAKQRPEFCKLVDRMESGDILVVTKLDRLGRNAMDVRSTAERLEKANRGPFRGFWGFFRHRLQFTL